MASERTATFGIRVNAETNADLSALSVEELGKAILASQEAVKSFGSSLRTLRGNSDEVTAAKAKLRAAQNAERDAVSRATLELGKQGKTLFDVTKKTEGSAGALDSLKKGLTQAGGPTAELSKRFEGLKAMFSGAGSSALLAGMGFGILLAGVTALAAGVVSAAVALGSFILTAGNELRTMNLFREAATGSAENAKAFGHQIEVLATKVPMSTKELNDLSLSLTKSVINTRVTGKALIDTFNAVAQTSSAMGDSAGKAIEDIILRGKQMGRMSLGVNELQGTGIQFTDVAKQLSANLKIGLLDAQMMLRNGRVKIDDGAKAIREVVEKKFGKVNMALMLDLPKLTAKFRDSLVHLTDGVDMAPLLEGFKRIAGLFDKSSVSGGILKDLIADFGGIMTKVFVASLPFLEVFFTQLTLEALKLEIAFLKLGVWVKQTFGIDFVKGFGDADMAVSLAKFTFGALVVVLGALAVTAALVAAPFVLFGAAIYEAVHWGEELGKWLKTVDWGASGKAIVDGFINGILSGKEMLFSAVGGLADGIKEKFKNALGIHSPSKVFADFGQQTTAGYAEGVTENRGAANRAVAGMVDIPRATGGGGGSGGGPTSVSVTLSFPNAKSGDDVAKHLTSPSFKAEFVRVLEEIMLGAAIPTHTPQGDGT